MVFENDMRALLLGMDEPTLDDTMPDSERMSRAIQSEIEVQTVRIPYAFMV